MKITHGKFKRYLKLQSQTLIEAEETEVIESVSIGDKVNINDPLIVLESEKAAMEVPSDLSGTVKEIKIKEGDNVKEGQLFICRLRRINQN